MIELIDGLVMKNMIISLNVIILPSKRKQFILNLTKSLYKIYNDLSIVK